MRPEPPGPDPAALAELPKEALLEGVQRTHFRFFWEASHPVSALAPDTAPPRPDHGADLVAVGASGFGMMALLVAAERGWASREQVLDRLTRMLALLERAQRHHGAWPHFLHGTSGSTIPFMPRDDGGDLVETSFLCMGLLCARQYFQGPSPAEAALRAAIDRLWDEVEWSWYARDGDVLTWHWSPRHGWALDHRIRGWNECLITYVLAVASRRHAIGPEVYHHGFCTGADFRNGGRYFDIELPLGVPAGGPLFFAHYSFCGLDPRGLRDRYADYWQQNVNHVRINRAHCIANPRRHPGYGPDCWGLTASEDPNGYEAHAPSNDNGTIAPTAALASLPYAPQEVIATLRHFLRRHGERAFGPHGFLDAFCERRAWYAPYRLAIDQGPIVVMMENHRTGLLWQLFMGVPEVQAGLRRLGFSSPHLGRGG